MAFAAAAICLLMTSGVAEARGGRCGGGRIGFFNRGCNTNCGTCNTGCQQFVPTPAPAPIPANASATNSGCCPNINNSGCCPTVNNYHRSLFGFGCCGSGCR
jgi:hypothetical protein